MAMTPETVMGVVAKFQEARIFLTAAELDVFSLLAKGPLTAEEAAERLSATVRGLTLLCDALAAMGLLEKKEGKYLCPGDVAALLSKDSPRSVLPMVLLAAGGWKRWSRLTDIVRQGQDPSQTTGLNIEEQEQEIFSRAMHALAARTAPGIVAAINPGGARKLLDVGGGSGAYTQAFLEASPEMTATLFDLPLVIQAAQRRLAGSPLLDRIRFVAGDFYRDELPEGHDLALLSAVIHQNGPQENRQLYRKVFRALLPQGRLVIRDHVMNADHTRPVSGAFFAVNMLVVTAEGRTYSFEEIKTGLEEAGFVRIRLLQADERMNGLVEGFKP